MKALLQLLRGARIIARGTSFEGEIIHYLLPSGEILEIVRN